jgi:hypothetical protein
MSFQPWWLTPAAVEFPAQIASCGDVIASLLLIEAGEGSVLKEEDAHAAIGESPTLLRQALDYQSTARALAVCVAGWLMAIAVAIALGLAFGPTVS